MLDPQRPGSVNWLWNTSGTYRQLSLDDLIHRIPSNVVVNFFWNAHAKPKCRLFSWLLLTTGSSPRIIWLGEDSRTIQYVIFA